MRTKVTLFLLFLNAALFAFIYYAKLGPDNKPTDKNLVLGPETANIQSLEIATAGATTPIKIERTNETWSLSSPLQWPANEFAVSRIISELQQLHPYATFSITELTQTGQTLADFGLEKPPLTVTFTPAPAAPGTPAPKPVSLKIGDPTKAGNRLYILSPDGKNVHVVNRSLAESLALHLEDLRADTLFTIHTFEVQSFRLQPPAHATGIRISKDTNNRWLFESPFKTNNVRADKTATILAITELHKLRAKTFLDPKNIDPAKTGLGTPELQITLNGNNRHETLLVGLPVEPADTTPAPAATAPAYPFVEYYAQMDDKTPVFTVAIPTKPTSLLETLLSAQETLRDTHVLDLEPSTITTISLSAPNLPEVTLQRLESSTANPATAPWQVVRHNGNQGPQTLAADRELVELLLQRLSQLTAEKFVDDAPSTATLEDFGFNRPSRQITISRAKSPAGAVTTLQIGATAGNELSVYAKLAGQPYIYRVNSEILHNTPVSLLAYRDRLIRELPTGAQITGLKLTDLVNNTILLETSLPIPAPVNGITAPALPVSRETIDALTTQLRVLRAKTFLREEFANTITIGTEERPWRYRLDATLSLVGGAAAQTSISTFFFSDRTGGTTQYVGSPDLSLVFEAEQPLLDTFFAVVYGPKDPGPAKPVTPPAPPATTEPTPAPTPAPAKP